MNAAHLHLVLIHVPPAITAAAVVAAAWGAIRKRSDSVRLALLLLLFAGLTTPVVYIAGERTADRIGRVDGIDQNAIAPHEASARVTLIAISISAVAALIALIASARAHREPGSRIGLIALACALICSALVIRTANLGGAIHHPEASAQVVR